ncbi:MAG: hypothetical protein LBG62_03705 [Candidatus Methanoplasma sp.]|jgi:hypothetical protein|nr:hypothetical protein [Candidatus Methanoplasma sp.]
MAKKNDESDSGGYEPKATARHEKISRAKRDDIESMKKKLAVDRGLAKKYEAERKKEIKELPKGERKAAKAELKESVAKRKEAERRDLEKIHELAHRERAAAKPPKGKMSDEEWVEGGKKDP